MFSPEFVSFIAHADGMIAASTGPLHIAAAMNKIALGIYAPMRPIFPTRWAPLGKMLVTLCLTKNVMIVKSARNVNVSEAFNPSRS